MSDLALLIITVVVCFTCILAFALCKGHELGMIEISINKLFSFKAILGKTKTGKTKDKADVPTIDFSRKK